METDLLKQLADLLQNQKQTSSLIVFTSNKTDWLTSFNQPVILDPSKKYKLALVNLETYYSIPNVTEANNTFVYSKSLRAAQAKTITLPIGCYEIKQINAEIQRQLEPSEVKKKPIIEIGANSATLCSYIRIEDGYVVDMTASTIRPLLGFNSKIISGRYTESDYPVNIMPINSILVNCNIISGSYVAGVQQPVLYSFFPDVSPGYKIIEKPTHLVYLPITIAGSISSIRIWLTDQDGQPINLRGETITIRCELASY